MPSTLPALSGLKKSLAGLKKCKPKKGQAEIIQYTLTVLFSVLVLVSISLLIFNLYDNFIRADIEKSLNQIASQTADRILKLYEDGKGSRIQPVNTSVLITEEELRLPDSISKRNYEILLVSANQIWSNLVNVTVANQTIPSIISSSAGKIIARTTQDPIISVERDIPNIEASIQGRGEVTNNKLRYYRYNVNGTTYDKIVLGDEEIFIDIKQMG